MGGGEGEGSGRERDAWNGLVGRAEIANPTGRHQGE